MRAAITFSVLLGLSLGAVPVRGDVHDLSGGVLILHGAPMIEWTNYCQMWPGYQGIDSCQEQVTRIDVHPDDYYFSVVLHVIAAWTEPKEFCQVEFGLGDFDPSGYGWVMETEACFEGTGIETPSSGWPGPNEGVVLTATDVPWSGALAHVYVMGIYGYSYAGPVSPMAIPLAPHPILGFGGTVNCLDPPQAYPAVCFGAVGIGTDGLFWGQIKALYR